MRKDNRTTQPDLQAMIDNTLCPRIAIRQFNKVIKGGYFPFFRHSQDSILAKFEAPRSTQKTTLPYQFHPELCARHSESVLALYSGSSAVKALRPRMKSGNTLRISEVRRQKLVLRRHAPRLSVSHQSYLALAQGLLTSNS